MKNLTEMLNEAREEIYSVAFVDYKDKHDLPITVKISVPKEYSREFEEYLTKEKDNTIYNANGYTNDFEIED